jgi:hypothetical protein
LELYHAKQGNKHLYLAQGADHAQSLRTNPNAYDHAVGTFLEDFGLTTSEFGVVDPNISEYDEMAKEEIPFT